MQLLKQVRADPRIVILKVRPQKPQTSTFASRYDALLDHLSDRMLLTGPPLRQSTAKQHTKINVESTSESR